MMKHVTIKNFIVLIVLSAFMIGCGKDITSDTSTSSDDQTLSEQSIEVFELVSKVIYAPPDPLNSGSQAGFDNLAYQKGDVPIIAYMPPGTEFNYYLAIGEGIKTLADEFGATMTMEAPESGADIDGQLALLEDVILRKVDIIILSTHDETAAAPLVEQAVAQGIEVVIINSDILEFPTPVHAVVGYNQRKGTRKLANYVVKKFGQQPVKLGVIEGLPGWHSTERVGGFMDVINENKNFELLASVNGKWNFEGGEAASLQMLNEYGEIQMIFAANDYEILGAASTCKSLGRDDILLFGNDGDTACLEAIASGDVDATLHTSPYEMGIIALQVAFDGLSGTFKGGYVETPTIVVDQYSVDEFLRKPETLYPKPSKVYD